MTTINSQNVRMYTQEMEQMLGQMGGASGGNSFVNSIFTEQQQSEDSSSTKSTTWQSIFGIVEKFISLFSSNESSTASQEVKDESKKADDASNNIQASNDAIRQGADEFNVVANIQTELINGAKEDIEKDNEKLAEEQQAVQAILEQIEAQKKELEAAQSDPEKDPAKILETISGLSSGLKTHIDTITELKNDIESLSTVSVSAFAAIEEAADFAKELQEREQSNIENNAAELTNLSSQVVQTEATGCQNELTSAEVTVAAEAASTTIVTEMEAPKLFDIASDQSSAGTTRISGATSVLPQLQAGIGGLLNNTSLLEGFANAVGSSTGSFSNLVGEFNTILESTITSVGSLSNIETIKDNLDEAVEEDNELLNSGTADFKTGMNSSDSNKDSNEDKNEEKPPVGKENGMNSELSLLYKFKTPKVDLKLETA